MSALVRYDAARRALLEARSILEVKDVRDKAEALRTYARFAKDRELEMDAAEIRLRAERRVGEMLIELKRGVGLSAGGRPKTGSSEEPVFGPATLEALGVDKKLSVRAQKYAALPEAEFERRLGEWRDQETQRAARVLSSLLKAVARPAPAPTPPLPDGTYGVIYADPAWPFETWSDAGRDRSPDNHYPTMALHEIAALPVAKLAGRDCALLIWVPDTLIGEGLTVIAAWGFIRKGLGFGWRKPSIGLGYYTRKRLELCFLATRGSPPRLNADVDQLVEAPRGRHSEKPDEVAKRIERLFPGPYVELFARKPRPGWAAWGNEIPGGWQEET